MIKNYFKTAYRNFFFNKFYSAINIIGLTFGLAVGLLILLWVNDELSFDRFNHNSEQIFKVNASMGTGNTRKVWGGAQAPLADYAIKEVPGIINAVRIAPRGDNEFFKYHNKIFKAGNILYTDASIFKMFDFKWLNGNSNNPFPNDQSVIITQSTAKLYFGDKNPIGEVLVADNNDLYTVTGVTADCPHNSTIQFDMLFPNTSIKVWKAFLSQDWTRPIFKTYIQVKPGASLKAIEQNLARIHLKHQALVNVTDGSYQLQPLSKVHLYEADGSSAGMQAVKMFSIVALIILLIAATNYVNLSTARAMLRVKEVGVRKIVGARRVQLFFQFITETFLFFTITILLAFVLISFLMPFYNDLSGKQMQFSLFDLDVWKTIGVTIFITLTASSIYPAMLLSGFKPLSVLKGQISPGFGSNSLRKVLVVVQFVFSIGLIISTLIINRQLEYIRNKELGYDKAYVLSVPMLDMQTHYAAIKTELSAQPVITGITSATNSIINNDFSTSDSNWDGREPNSTFFIHVMEVDKDFMRFFKIDFNGSNFTGSKTDSAHYILNETAVREAGIVNPIGKKFRLNGLNGTIIGVVKDFHFASLKQKIEPIIFTYTSAARDLYIKTTGKSAPGAIKALQKIWGKYNGRHLFQYSFLDEDYDKMYKSDQRVAVLFDFFSAVAIFTSCLGLFGLATYTAQIKVREIGIRKILGASISNIVSLLSVGFLKLVCVSFIVAVPVSWFLMQKWLQGYAYHTTLEWWIFALAGMSALLISFITIGFQAVQSAIANPVKSLRSE
jgi:putative ABC transport system permease protein